MKSRNNQVINQRQQVPQQEQQFSPMQTYADPVQQQQQQEQQQQQQPLFNLSEEDYREIEQVLSEPLAPSTSKPKRKRNPTTNRRTWGFKAQMMHAVNHTITFLEENKLLVPFDQNELTQLPEKLKNLPERERVDLTSLYEIVTHSKLNTGSDPMAVAAQLITFKDTLSRKYRRMKHYKQQSVDKKE